MINVPIVILIFNRPDLTAKVFERVRQVKPKTLLVVADGPRATKEGESVKCQETRAITEQIDWECKVFRNYSDVNLGCGLRVSSGIDWVFEQVERAIILEDDCLPNLDFFRFCEELLEKYQDESHVTMISGTNFLSGQTINSESYYFSCLPAVWGWATWRRAWKLYDYNMKFFPQFSKFKGLDYIFSDTNHQKYWFNILKDTYDADKKVTWDFQWVYAQWSHGGLAIVPSVNLVSNIGYGEDATHTKKKSKLSNIPTSEITFPLKHPLLLSRNLKMDILIQNKVFMKNLLYRIAKYLAKNFMPLKSI
jgi:hypothetical protein